MTIPTRPDVVVVGGGLIGLSIAWRTALTGASVTLVDPGSGAAASHVAAGMLAPVTEVHYGEEPLLALTLAAAARYPSYVAELEDATGMTVGYRQTGTLAVGLDADDRAVLADLHAYQHKLGLDVELLSSRECRRREPMLSPAIRGGLLVRDDHSVDNRRLTAALTEAVRRAGVRQVTGTVEAVRLEQDRARGVTLGDGTALDADAVVLAAGCWSGRVPGVPAEAVPPVRPVKGHILRLQGPPGVLTGTVRAVVEGTHLYLVPRADGEIVVGATMEEMGYDVTVRAGAVYELLRDATRLVPGVAELALVESATGLRPGSPDNAPILGPCAVPGLLLATGHYRNGVLLAPLTGDLLAETLGTGTGTVGELAAAFSPLRFDAPAVA